MRMKQTHRSRTRSPRSFDHPTPLQKRSDRVSYRMTKEKLRLAVEEAKRLLGLDREMKRQAASGGRSGVIGIVDRIESLKEERRCYLAAMKECAFVQSELAHLLDDFPALALGAVMKDVRNSIWRTKPDLVKSVKKGLTCRTIVFLFMSDVTWDELRTGKHMAYSDRSK